MWTLQKMQFIHSKFEQCYVQRALHYFAISNNLEKMGTSVNKITNDWFYSEVCISFEKWPSELVDLLPDVHEMCSFVAVGGGGGHYLRGGKSSFCRLQTVPFLCHMTVILRHVGYSAADWTYTPTHIFTWPTFWIGLGPEATQALTHLLWWGTLQYILFKKVKDQLFTDFSKTKYWSEQSHILMISSNNWSYFFSIGYGQKPVSARALHVLASTRAHRMSNASEINPLSAKQWQVMARFSQGADDLRVTKLQLQHSLTFGVYRKASL